MRLETLIKIADSGYPDSRVAEAYAGRPAGDGLAEFVVCELRDAFDNADEETCESQLDSAVLAIGRAERELFSVKAILEKHLQIARTKKRLLPGMLGKDPVLDEVIADLLKEKK